jgi:isopentenyl-diphosphate delta-isomerase
MLVMAEERVILVDKDDQEIGTEEKLRAHRNGGKLHRAFSVFIFNSEGRMLLQRRAAGKYHCPGLWTNACCSHPRPGESSEAAAHRKLKQEMGFDVPLKGAFSFVYKADFSNGLTEHEFDYVFAGTFDGKPQMNPDEADAFKWVDIAKLKKDVAANPDKYTPWFRIVFERVADWNAHGR